MKNILYIITTDNFRDCFQDFIIHKQRLGFTVKTSTVKNIGHGTYEDIKEFLNNESAKENDDYYVILGGDANFIPSEMVMPSVGKNLRCSDYLYARSDVDDHWRSIGRFPANTENEITDMCNAAISYETDPNFKHGNSLLMIAATRDNITATNELESSLNGIFDSISVCRRMDDSDKEPIAQRIIASADQFINYMGHGGTNSWYGHFKSNRVPRYNSKHPHVLSWACSTANIQHTGFVDCLGSKFLKEGAVSFWGAYDKTYGDDNRRMVKEFWDIYQNSCPDHIGDIYLEIYKKFYKYPIGCEKYMLLGDPTLKIK